MAVTTPKGDRGGEKPMQVSPGETYIHPAGTVTRKVVQVYEEADWIEWESEGYGKQEGRLSTFLRWAEQARRIR